MRFAARNGCRRPPLARGMQLRISCLSLDDLATTNGRDLELQAAEVVGEGVCAVSVLLLMLAAST